MKEIIPNVNENLNMTETEKKYKKIIDKLNKRKKQRNFGVLGITLGFAAVGVLIAGVLSLGAASSAGVMMSFSPWLYVPVMSLIGGFTAAGWASFLVNPEIKELKRQERKYAPDIAEDRKKELEKVVEKSQDLSEIKKENDEFLIQKQNQIEAIKKTREQRATAKVDIVKNIELEKPKEEFSPTEELQFLKQLKEQAKEEAAERRRNEFMDTMMQGMNDKDKGSR